MDEDARVKYVLELRRRRDTAARNLVLFSGDTGRAVQRGQALAYNEALKLMGVDDGSDQAIIDQEAADVKSVRGW